MREILVPYLHKHEDNFFVAHSSIGVCFADVILDNGVWVCKMYHKKRWPCKAEVDYLHKLVEAMNEQP